MPLLLSASTRWSTQKRFLFFCSNYRGLLDAPCCRHPLIIGFNCGETNRMLQSPHGMERDRCLVLYEPADPIRYSIPGMDLSKAGAIFALSVPWIFRHWRYPALNLGNTFKNVWDKGPADSPTRGGMGRILIFFHLVCGWLVVWYRFFLRVKVCLTTVQ